MLCPLYILFSVPLTVYILKTQIQSFLSKLLVVIILLFFYKCTEYLLFVFFVLIFVCRLEIQLEWFLLP